MSGYAMPDEKKLRKAEKHSWVTLPPRWNASYVQLTFPNSQNSSLVKLNLRNQSNIFFTCCMKNFQNLIFGFQQE